MCLLGGRSDCYRLTSLTGLSARPTGRQHDPRPTVAVEYVCSSFDCNIRGPLEQYRTFYFFSKNVWAPPIRRLYCSDNRNSTFVRSVCFKRVSFVTTDLRDNFYTRQRRIFNCPPWSNVLRSGTLLNFAWHSTGFNPKPFAKSMRRQFYRVSEWFDCFKNGRIPIVSELRKGWLSVSLDEQIIGQVRGTITADRRLKSPMI